MSDKLNRVWRGTEEKSESIGQDSRCPGRDSKRIRLEYKLATLPF